MKELLEIINYREAHSDLPFALATVVKVEGSSYRKPGARMLIGGCGRVAGSVSSGCLEKDVISKGLHVILRKKPELAIYDTTDQDNFGLGSSSACKGHIEILIEPVLPDKPWPLTNLVQDALQHHSARTLATLYRGADDRIFALHYMWNGERRPEGKGFLHKLETDMQSVLLSRKSITRNYSSAFGNTSVFIECIAPPLRLVVFGSGHDVLPLVRIANELGCHVTMVNQQPGLAANFPGSEGIIYAKPHQVKDRVRLDHNTSVVIMNHQYETDSALLAELLPIPLCYVGMLGPRKRTNKILEELTQAGSIFNEEQLQKLHAPAGLDIGSETPEQIALSILAEIIAVTSARNEIHLKDRISPIQNDEIEPDGHHTLHEDPQRLCSVSG